MTMKRREFLGKALGALAVAAAPVALLWRSGPLIDERPTSAQPADEVTLGQLRKLVRELQQDAQQTGQDVFVIAHPELAADLRALPEARGLQVRAFRSPPWWRGSRWL